MSGPMENAFEVKWCINNIKSWLKTGDLDPLYSPQFLAETLTNTRWKLSLSTNWQLAEKYLSLAVQRDVEDNGPEFIALRCEISFLACDGSLLKSKSFTQKFSSKTVSRDLNVKVIEILKDKKEVYLPENVLTVRCKLWKAFTSVSKGWQCLIQSVIGTKCVKLNATIDNFRELDESTNVTLNFMSPSTEISFISFDVCKDENSYLNFERMEVQSNLFSSYSCKLFALSAAGQQTECFKNNDLSTLLSAEKECIFQSMYECPFLYFLLQTNSLKLQLVITYFPGVVSESIEWEVNDFKKLYDKSADVENVNPFNAEKSHSSPADWLCGSEGKDKPCDIEVNESSDEDQKDLPSTTFKIDLTSLCNDRLFCDTKLQTDTETFPAHRCVLSARSPVFKKMFATDMKEKVGECINVPDISSDTIRRMLQFLYTDCTGDLEMQSAMDLYIASDKYDIASLKRRCSSFMKKNLSTSNVCEVLVLADMHQDKDLESVAHDFVLTFDKEVLHSEEWKLFMKDFSSLAAQVMYLKCIKE